MDLAGNKLGVSVGREEPQTTESYKNLSNIKKSFYLFKSDVYVYTHIHFKATTLLRSWKHINLVFKTRLRSFGLNVWNGKSFENRGQSFP